MKIYELLNPDQSAMAEPTAPQADVAPMTTSPGAPAPMADDNPPAAQPAAPMQTAGLGSRLWDFMSTPQPIGQTQPKPQTPGTTTTSSSGTGTSPPSPEGHLSINQALQNGINTLDTLK